MVQEQIVPVEFGKGLDTKSDSKSVIPGKFLRLENGVFTSPNEIRKRNGYTATGTTEVGVGTMSAPKMVHGYKNELLCADQGKVFSYSSNQDAWLSVGNYVSADLSRQMISQNRGATGVSDVSVLGNYILYGWVNLAGEVWVSVSDLSTGTILITSRIYTEVTSTPMRIKCVTLGGTTLCVVYYKATNSAYGARTVTFSGSGTVSFSGETVITTTNCTGAFDIAATSTGGAFIYAQSGTPGVTVATLSTALAVATTTIAAASPLNVFISVGSNGNIWPYWNATTNDGAGNLTASTLRYAVLNSSLGSVLVATSIAVLASPYYVSNMISMATSTTGQTLFYGILVANGGSSSYLEATYQVTVTSTGTVGSPGLFSYGVIPVSHPFTYGTSTYAMFCYRTAAYGAPTLTSNVPVSDQPKYFILDLTYTTSSNPLPTVAARFANGVGVSLNQYYTSLLVSPNVATYGSSQFKLACGLVVQGISGISSYIFGEVQAFVYTFDFAGSNVYQAKNAGNLAILNGGCLQAYDGAALTEWGYHFKPKVIAISASAYGGTGLAAGTYNYAFIFQWVDNNGDLHQSEPTYSTQAAVNVSNQITIITSNNYLSNKIGATLVVYRTVASGSIYYQVTNVTYGTVSPFSATLTTIDTSPDADITARPQAYTSPSSPILENTSPAPSSILLAHNNRLWYVDAENPNNIWYSKSYLPGNGLSPSDSLLEELDPKFGIIAGLAEMDEKLVTGKQAGFFIQSGDGADDSGSNSTLSFPQMVPSDVGITQNKGTITQPNGVMFKSGNGIYLLSRSLSVVYIGAEVESYNSQTITGASLVPGKSQIRFLCSSGSTLVYDYIFNQWSVFTNHTGTSSTTWNSLYAYATTGGRVYYENTSGYTDDTTAYSLLAQTSWLSFASIQGFQRVKRFIMLGDFVNGNSASHNLSVQAAYNFSSTFGTAVPYAFGAISASGVFQYRDGLQFQKCDSVSFLIQETTTGSSAEYVALTNMSFEVGAKKGVNKLSASNTVG